MGTGHREKREVGVNIDLSFIFTFGVVKAK